MEGGSPESLAVTNHVGLIGQTVTDQIPFIKVDPNQHPMDQLNGTLDTATKLKDEATRLWETITKIVEASQKLSDKSHVLQVTQLSGPQRQFMQSQKMQSKVPTM